MGEHCGEGGRGGGETGRTTGSGATLARTLVGTRPPRSVPSTPRPCLGWRVPGRRLALLSDPYGISMAPAWAVGTASLGETPRPGAARPLYLSVRRVGEGGLPGGKCVRFSSQLAGLQFPR